MATGVEVGSLKPFSGDAFDLSEGRHAPYFDPTGKDMKGYPLPDSDGAQETTKANEWLAAGFTPSEVVEMLAWADENDELEPSEQTNEGEL